MGKNEKICDDHATQTSKNGDPKRKQLKMYL